MAATPGRSAALHRERHSWSSNKAGAPSAGQRESYTLTTATAVARLMACCAASTMPRGHVQGQPHALKAGTGLSTKSPS
jgi:hypothetical protein